jgi:hypothetical protein
MSKLTRRSFLKGLAATTVLAPMLAQVAPSPFTLSMFDPYTLTEGVPSNQITPGLVRKMVRQLRGEIGQVDPIRFVEPPEWGYVSWRVTFGAKIVEPKYGAIVLPDGITLDDVPHYARGDDTVLIEVGGHPLRTTPMQAVDVERERGIRISN